MIDIKRYYENGRQYSKLLMLVKSGHRAKPTYATLGVDFGKPIGLKIKTRFQLLCGPKTLAQAEHDCRCKARGGNRRSLRSTPRCLRQILSWGWIDQRAGNEEIRERFCGEDLRFHHLRNGCRIVGTRFFQPPTPGSEARGRSASPHKADQEEQKDRANRCTNNLPDYATASKQAKPR